VSPVVLKAMKKGNLKSFVSGERSRALWALLYLKHGCCDCELLLNVFYVKELFLVLCLVCPLESGHFINWKDLHAQITKLISTDKL